MFLLASAESIQLFPDGTIFIHIALVLAMIWILNRTFFRPINRVIESRESSKGGYGSEAEKILHEVAEKEAKLNKAMLDARSAGYALIEKERMSAVESRNKKIVEAKVEMASVFEAEKRKLTEQAEIAHAAIAEEAVKMAEQVASNVLKG